MSRSRSATLPLIGMSLCAAVLVGAAAVAQRSGADATSPVSGASTQQPAQADGPGAPVVPTPDVPATPAVPSTPTAAAPADPTLAPARLQIARLGVDAPVDITGVAGDGQAEIPEDARRVGWYRFSTTPGSAEGSVTLVGHVDSFEQGKGALYPMRGARVGDVIVVTRADGVAVRYDVVDVTRYDKKSLPAATLFGRGDVPRLTVITCGGPYVKSLGGYQQNLVVTAYPAGGGS